MTTKTNNEWEGKEIEGCNNGKHRGTENDCEDWDKEEWGGWKIVSDMLDNKRDGIYQTSECYRKLYGFVVAQKEKALSSERQRLKKEIQLAVAEEANIARQENQPTSRLTSLAMKISKLLEQ